MKSLIYLNIEQNNPIEIKATWWFGLLKTQYNFRANLSLGTNLFSATSTVTEQEEKHIFTLDTDMNVAQLYNLDLLGHTVV